MTLGVEDGVVECRRGLPRGIAVILEAETVSLLSDCVVTRCIPGL